jgi:transcriptional regulator with XRE-family HTH domain
VKQSVQPGPGEGMMFASELIKARQVKSYTQSQLSAQSGLSLSAIKAYESGRNMPGARELKQLCETLEVSANKLLFGTELPFQTRSWLDLITDASVEEDSVQRSRTGWLLHLLSSDERQAIFTLIQSIAIARHGQPAVLEKILSSDMQMAMMTGMAEDAKFEQQNGKAMSDDQKQQWIDDFMIRHGHSSEP